MTTHAQQQLSFSEVVQSRHSVRNYNAAFKISEEEIRDLLQEATLAPSSSNLQSWRFIVITDPQIKEQLLPIANNQKQIATASAIIAVLGDKEAYKNAGEIYDLAVQAGRMSQEVRDGMVERITNGYGSMSPEEQSKVAWIDGGLVSQQIMLSAKARGYDTVPMGGYNVEAFRSFFSISDRYVNVMLIALGKADDQASERSSGRLPLDRVMAWNETLK